MAVASSIIAASIIASASAGSAIYAAHKQSDSADKATDTASHAADEALAFQKDQLAKRETQLAPYIGAGQQSLGKLSDLMGLPRPAAPSGGWETGSSLGTAPPGSDTTGRRVGTPGTSVNTGEQAVLRPVSALTSGTPPLRNGPMPTGGGGASSYVTMQAPTGETQQVSPDQVQHFESRGARRVS